MSALRAFSNAAEGESATERFVDVAAAAAIADCHPETIRDAARAGLLHGAQRRRVDPQTGRIRTKGGTWRFRPECVKKWDEGELCEHQQDEGRPPVSLAGFMKGRK